MIELGCVAAIGLDGGGSTTITVTQPDDTTRRYHQPSLRRQ